MKVVKMQIELNHGSAEVKITKTFEAKGTEAPGSNTCYTTIAGLQSIFSGGYDLGYVPCSHLGLAYFKAAGDRQYAVIQRPPTTETIKYEGRNYEVKSPWTVATYVLGTANGRMTRLREYFFVSDNPVLGDQTKLYSAGAIFPNVGGDGVVCWGNIRALEEVTVKMLPGIVNGFFTSDFTNHIQKIDRWKDCDGKVAGHMITTLGEHLKGLESGRV